MSTRRAITLVATALALALALVACTGDDNGPVISPPANQAEAGVDGSGGDAAPNDSGGCTTPGPDATNREIINACTDAESLDKHPRLPLLRDGALPPLP